MYVSFWYCVMKKRFASAVVRGTDFCAVRDGYVSITPIHVDLTRYEALEKVAGWVGSLSMESDAA